ncbi:MAG TPA: BrnA antitoxin family protein [Pyrinomonadaceae bacterium]|nr:BrnA antitoxin family protein [Pyrinomonadaceae bacterium]
MNGKNSSNISKTNWDRLAAMTDEEIDVSDIPEQGDDFFANAKLRMPAGKSPVLLNVDSDVLEWFKEHGSEFHRLVNSALRDYAESHR